MTRLQGKTLLITGGSSGMGLETTRLALRQGANVAITGRSGTSIENLIMTVRGGRVVRMEVADTTLDLVLYLHERGWAFPQNIRPVPIIRGIERPPAQPEVDLRQTSENRS